MVQCPVSLSDMHKATTELRGVMNRTPLLETLDVNAMFGRRPLQNAHVRTARMVEAI